MWSTTTAASLFWLAGFATTVTEAFVPLSSRHSSWKMTSTTPLFAVSEATLSGAQAMIDGIIDEKNCNPVFVRLAWHDSGTHDASITDPWPAAGGAIGSIRFKPEIAHGANAGLAGAVALLEPVKEAFPEMSYADIFQMASARSIELAGGPKIDMKYVVSGYCACCL
jgi:Peroxidase